MQSKCAEVGKSQVCFRRMNFLVFRAIMCQGVEEIWAPEELRGFPEVKVLFCAFLGVTGCALESTVIQTKEAWFVVCSRLSGCHGTPVSWGWKMQQHSRSHSTPPASFLCLKCKSEILGKSKAKLFPPGFEPGTFRVLGERDNHYTTETTQRHTSNDIPKNSV